LGVAGKAAILLDRTAVLFLGLALGGVITFSFFASGEQTKAEGGTGTPPAQLAANVVPAAAQADQPGIVGPRLASAAVEGRKIHVGVFGDSFGDGIHAALYHQLAASDGFDVHKFSHQATGFTRYRTTNLLDDTRQKLDAQPIDVAVLSFGANDMQGVFVDGHGSEFMSDRWKQIVGQRVGEVVALLRQRGAAVYWVGLPRMREAEYDRNVQAMNAFYVERMGQLGVPFVETLSASVDASGGYAPYLRDPKTGAQFSARTNDGVHMTIPGYYLLTRGLSERIRKSVVEARAQAGQPSSRQAAASGAGATRS
jgi:hypothetical protein